MGDVIDTRPEWQKQLGKYIPLRDRIGIAIELAHKELGDQQCLIITSNVSMTLEDRKQVDLAGQAVFERGKLVQVVDITKAFKGGENLQSYLGTDKIVFCQY